MKTRQSKSTFKSTSKSTQPLVPEAAVRQMETLLRQAEERLVVGDPIAARQRPQALVLRHVPAAAIQLAIDLAQRHPDSFGDFDVIKARQVLAYEAAMAPIVQECRAFAARLDDSVMRAWYEIALQTLALYGSAKSLKRLPGGQAMLPQLRELSLLVRTRVRSRKGAKAVAEPATPVAASPPAAEKPPLAIAVTGHLNGVVANGVNTV